MVIDICWPAAETLILGCGAYSCWITLVLTNCDSRVSYRPFRAGLREIGICIVSSHPGFTPCDLFVL